MVLQTYAIISARFVHSEALNACPHACMADILPAKPSLDFSILYSAISFGLVTTVEIILKQKTLLLIRKSTLNAYYFLLMFQGQSKDKIALSSMLQLHAHIGI